MTQWVPDPSVAFYSYKFHRLFPLSQYDLPTHNPNILSFPTPTARSAGPDDAASSNTSDIVKQPTSSRTSSSSIERAMNQEQIAKNPGVDYTRWEAQADFCTSDGC